MRKIIFQVLLLLTPLIIHSQTLTLDSCQSKARKNYPLVKQYGLIEKTEDYNLRNASMAYLPQFNLSARATYQSEVTKLPITLPGIIIPELTKDQYQATLELSQVIWDGGVTAAQKNNIKANAQSEKQKLEVDLYMLRDRINQLYFGILLINKQLSQNSILEDELKNNYNKISSMIKNGLATLSDLNVIKVEQINAVQRETELQSTKKSFMQMLAAFIGAEISENVTLEMPVMGSINNNPILKRPELLLLDAQNEVLDSQKKLILAGNLPKIGAFVQGGWGKPGLNMLTNEFSPFYIGGVRLAWNISGFYTQKNNYLKIDAGKKNIEIQKETFLFNNSLITKQQLNEINKLKSVLNNDDEIITLKQSIKNSTGSKLENGTATVNDLLRDLNSENNARQIRSLHEIQLYSTYYQYLSNSNN